jgi:hypothetical protein
MRGILRGLFIILAVTLATLVISCGGSGSGSISPPPPATPDFSLSVSPASLTVAAGTSANFQVSIQPTNGFTGNVAVQVSGLPTGATLTPGTTFSVSQSSPQSVTVTCASGISPGSYTLQLLGTSGSLSHTRTESLTVQAPPDFALVLTPSSLSLPSGGRGNFQVAIQASGGFSQPVQVQISGLPTGATVTPVGSFVVYPSQPQTITVASAVSLATGSYRLGLTGSSGSLSHTATETLAISNFGPPSRADFVRTDDTPGEAVYDQVHQRIYVTNPALGTVDVISSLSYQVLRTIRIPSPSGIDISPDSSTVFVGTSTQALYALDTSTMALTSMYLAPLHHENDTVVVASQPLGPVATPDGAVLVSLVGEIVKWNPMTDQVTTVLTDPPYPFPGPITPRIGPIARSAGHTKVIMSDEISDSTVYVYDTTTNTFSSVKSSAFAGLGLYVYSVAVNPSGTQFAVAGTDMGGTEAIFVFDRDLHVIAVIEGGGRLLYSRDGKVLYLSAMFGQVPLIGMIDTTTFRMTGTSPLYASCAANRSPTMYVSTPLVADETGRVFGSADHGLSIDDVNDVRTYIGTEVYPLYASMLNPNAGAVDQAQDVELFGASFKAVPEIWFGPRAGSTVMNGSIVTATAPAMDQIGPVNVRVEQPDEVRHWIPQAYTYGAVLSEGADIAGPAQGNSTVRLWGYGIAGNTDLVRDQPTTTVRFGGVQGAATFLGTEDAYPFPLARLDVTTPSVPLGPADITVITNSATSTRRSAYHSLNMPSYALGGTPVAMAFDSRRQRLYIAVADHLEVFSVPGKTFLPTIQVPTLNNFKQLGGLALTPDGSRLIVANWADASVAVINPDNPSNATAVSVGIPPSLSPWFQGPNQLGATNTGLVFIGVGGGANWGTNSRSKSRHTEENRSRLAAPATEEPSVWVLDLNSMSAKPYAPMNAVAAAPFISGSPDGEQVCLVGLYLPLTVYHSATSTTTTGSGGDSCYVNGSLVLGTQSQSGLSAYVNNLNLEGISQAMLPDYEQYGFGLTGQLIGGVVDNTGALMYLPFRDRIELFDTHTGEHRESISLPISTDGLLDGSLAIDNTGTQVFMPFANSMILVQIDALPLAIGSVSESGGSWTIAGTGFSSATTVSADGKPLSVRLTDSVHLEVFSAPDLSTVHFVTLTNSDGHSYTYDVAYLK